MIGLSTAIVSVSGGKDSQETANVANDEMVEGYRDGLDLSVPEPSDNRSHSYRHGFANGRDDRAGKPRGSRAELEEMGNLSMEKDRKIYDQAIPDHRPD